MRFDQRCNEEYSFSMQGEFMIWVRQGRARRGKKVKKFK